MNPTIRLKIAAFSLPAFLATGMFGAAARADNITVLANFTGSGIDDGGPGGVNGSQGSDESTVSGQAEFELDTTTNQLLVYLTNTTAASQMYTTHDLLDSLGFDLTGVTLQTNSNPNPDSNLVATATGKTAGVPSGTAVTNISANENLNTGWGAASTNPSSEFGDNYFVTAAASFDITQSLNGSTLDDNAYGIIPAIANVANADSFSSHTYYTYGTLETAFNLVGTPLAGAFSFSNIQFFYGGPTTPDENPYQTGDANGYAHGGPTPTPEPASLGLMTIGALMLLKRGRKKKA
ncbi:MAG TPA: PEP-CTERM sorting domain-containing protein [Phycisphaerae bacterium]|nr:PEP-CTERM sorting domain-containing protein [Phycisphaerae bacterium]